MFPTAGSGREVLVVGNEVGVVDAGEGLDVVVED
jgi:hypothetical protein